MPLFSTLLQLLPDGGPVYTETNLDHFIVEPFNALSCLFFVGMTVYWVLKLKGRYKEFWFLTTCIIFLGIGSVGGTFYHAFRESHTFLLMDWVPILILCFMAGVYLLYKVTRKRYYAVSVIIGALIIQSIVWKFSISEHSHFAININYAFMAAIVVGPTFSHLLVNNFYKWKLVVFALGAFGLALFFRISDSWGILPMGTHFLWHTFGALAANFMFMYVYKVDRNEHRLDEWENRMIGI
ncbi:hypothetical protein [Solitalea canadensis]|uniref:Hemolysin III n=1 Tax=Solitalea canadensis (strain ATCC 29591 / DSM 3403 / JCM 21819 / LMG 8368 / NBRC 15130 / NCIMB 12057 / USAM 9D) TaxID=929556 RepID=H8KLS3_SOLCM|nr:hypothetical protein [Solitalea canadensis]AFD09227.1 hypothetical protein Solca_4237 [Solitalea canadensis DSM 3403]